MTTRSGTTRSASKPKKKSGSTRKSASRKTSAAKRPALKATTARAAAKRKTKRPTKNARIQSRGAKHSERAGLLSAFRFPLFRTEESTQDSVTRSSRRIGKKATQPSRLIGAVGAVRKAGRDYEKMPSWRELDAKTNAREIDSSVSAFDSISTTSMALIIAVIVAVFTLYIGNVYSTQQELSRLQTLQSANSDLRMKLNRVKGDYDHMVGPAQIHSRAKQIGLIESESRPLPVIFSPK